jgi:hypothetical protein
VTIKSLELAVSGMVIIIGSEYKLLFPYAEVDIIAIVILLYCSGSDGVLGNMVND